MKLNKGDLLWIDTAPLVGSEKPTGQTIMCEVLADSPEEAQQVLVLPDGGEPLSVFKKWMTAPLGYWSYKR